MSCCVQAFIDENARYALEVRQAKLLELTDMKMKARTKYYLVQPHKKESKNTLSRMQSCVHLTFSLIRISLGLDMSKLMR